MKLDGNLSVPEGAYGVVRSCLRMEAAAAGSRNRHVARLLNEAMLATLLIDLLTSDEEAIDARTAHLRFDIGLLAERLAGATDWLTQYPETRHLRISYFGASTGAVAALVAAAERPDANLGSEYPAALMEGQPAEAALEQVMDFVRRAFRPEFRAGESGRH